MLFSIFALFSIFGCSEIHQEEECVKTRQSTNTFECGGIYFILMNENERRLFVDGFHFGVGFLEVSVSLLVFAAI